MYPNVPQDVQHIAFEPYKLVDEHMGAAAAAAAHARQEYEKVVDFLRSWIGKEEGQGPLAEGPRVGEWFGSACKGGCWEAQQGLDRSLRSLEWKGWGHWRPGRRAASGVFTQRTCMNCIAS